jgi:hypothetical protein
MGSKTPIRTSAYQGNCQVNNKRDLTRQIVFTFVL